jgi:hypothetical protein
MAAGDFTDSALQVAQVRLEEMFAAPNTAQTELKAGSASTARAMLARQRSRVIPRLTGNTVVGVEAWYIRPHAATNAATTAPADCDVPCGDEAETIKADYESTVLVRSKSKVLDNRSDNLLQFAEEIAAQQAHMMSQMRVAFNRDVVIAGVAAASQVNIDTQIDSTWDYTSNSPRITVPTADFTYERFNEFQTVAMLNNFDDFFMVSGRLLSDDRWRSQLNRMNEGFRDQALAYAQQEIYFDLRDLDQKMTRKTLFAVNANSYAFWNTVRNTTTPRRVVTADGEKWVWVQADPILSWNNNGVLSPVLYEFEMAVTCVGRDAQEFQQNQYCIYARLIGGFEFAPTGPNGEKGVLQFSTE